LNQCSPPAALILHTKTQFGKHPRRASSSVRTGDKPRGRNKGGGIGKRGEGEGVGEADFLTRKKAKIKLL